MPSRRKLSRLSVNRISSLYLQQINSSRNQHDPSLRFSTPSIYHSQPISKSKQADMTHTHWNLNLSKLEYFENLLSQQFDMSSKKMNFL